MHNFLNLMQSFFRWSYQSAEQLSNPSVSGQIATYGGGGSVQDLSSLKNESKLILKELKEGLWIGRGTRVIFIDFTLYNANLNLFCIVKYVNCCSFKFTL